MAATAAAIAIRSVRFRCEAGGAATFAGAETWTPYTAASRCTAVVAASASPPLPEETGIFASWAIAAAVSCLGSRTPSRSASPSAAGPCG